jgi:quinol monooxygenase YgiN
MSVKHIVLIRFTDDASSTKVDELSKGFAALASLVPGITGFEAGQNTSPEGLNRGFTHAFVMRFVDPAARDAYLPHAHHQAFVERLKPCLADVLVIDFEPSSF